MRIHEGSNAQRLGNRVRAFERRQNSLRARQLHYRIERGRIILRNVLRASRVVQHGVFRPMEA